MFAICCQEHPKDDDEHQTVELEEYQATPAVYKNVRCDEHNKRVTSYCTRCEMFGCTLCEDLPCCISMCFAAVLSNFGIDIDICNHAQKHKHNNGVITLSGNSVSYFHYLQRRQPHVYYLIKYFT